MADENRISAVRGVTASTQIAWHLQSYLLYFDMGKFPKQWLQCFFAKVQPVNTKFEVVLAYEIGLGKAISAARYLLMRCSSQNQVCAGGARWHGEER